MLEEQGKSKTYAAGETIFRRGDRGSEMYIV